MGDKCAESLGTEAWIGFEPTYDGFATRRASAGEPSLNPCAAWRFMRGNDVAPGLRCENERAVLVRRARRRCVTEAARFVRICEHEAPGYRVCMCLTMRERAWGPFVVGERDLRDEMRWFAAWTELLARRACRMVEGDFS